MPMPIRSTCHWEGQTAMPVVAEEYEFAVGVDTHARTHTYAMVDTNNGVCVATESFPTTAAIRRYIAREIYDQLLHPQPAPDAGALRALRKTKRITLQAAADKLHVWLSALSRLERGLTRDDLFHQRYENWLNEQ
jgi:hypothetical protein